MMINALRYEPFGQRQRFEPREQQSSEEQHKHIHLHLHLHLGAWVRYSSHPTVARVTRIFAACVGAFSMALTLNLQTSVRDIPQPPLFALTGNLITSGVWLALGAVLLGGIPLVVSAWRSRSRSRFLLLVPLLTVALTIFYFLLISWVQQMTHYTAFNNLGPTFHNVLLALPFYGVPIISTIAINRAMRGAALSDKWLRFANMLSGLVVLGILLILIGVLLWGFALALFAPGWFVLLISPLTFPWNSWLLIFLGMLITAMVALWALFSRSRSREQAEAHPKDASPADFDSFQEPRGYRG